MPRAFYLSGEMTEEERIECIDRCNIEEEDYYKVPNWRLEREIERLEEKQDRLKHFLNEDLERVRFKINSIKKHLEINKNKI